MLVVKKRSKAHLWAGICLGTLAASMTFAVAYSAEQSERIVAQPKINPGVAPVDEVIQRISEKALADALVAEEAKGGFVIVADPNTGRILSVANVGLNAGKSPHWALAREMWPASIMKTMVAAQAIEKGLTSPSESLNCEHGRYHYGDRDYYDYNKDGWDHLTTTQTIAVSSDICSIKLGERLGANGLMDMLENFGFGPDGSAKTFPEAQPGHLPPADDPAHPRIVPFVPSGFGFQITPLEILQAYGAIANGGNLLKPLLSTASDSEVQVVRRILSSETAIQMRSILEQVVLNGTAKGYAASDLYTTAVRTGSSFSTDSSAPTWEKKSDVASIVGFAPVTNPRVEVYVLIEDPHKDAKGGAHGGPHAGPVFKRIVEEVLKEMKVSPDKPRI